MSRIAITPSDRLRRLVGVPDVRANATWAVGLSWMQALPRMKAHVLDAGHKLLETHAAAAVSLMRDFIRRIQREGDRMEQRKCGRPVRVRGVARLTNVEHDAMAGQVERKRRQRGTR